jgi:glycine betaine/proline transport system substrate-binding protein
LYNYFRRGFEADQPEAATFQNFNLEELVRLVTIIKTREEAGAKEWYEANKVLVDSWMK